MNDRKTLAVAFVATFGVIIAGAAVVGFATADGADAPPELENDHYLDEDLVRDGTPGEADVTMSSREPSQTVLIDPGADAAGGPPIAPLALLGLGGDGVADRDVRPLVNALIENGHEVRIHTPDPAAGGPGEEDGPTELGKDLAEADAFVTFRTEYGAAEVEDVETFVEADGHVLLASDADAEFDQPGAASLDAALGVTTEPGYVYNMEEHDLNYQRVYAEPDGSSPVTDGVDRTVFQSATPVGSAAGGAELRPIDGSQLSTTRAPTDEPLLAQADGTVIVGDSDFMSPENAQRADNDVLIGNLADFLVTNDRNPDFQPPEAEDDGASAEPVPPERPEEPVEEEPEPIP